MSSPATSTRRPRGRFSQIVGGQTSTSGPFLAGEAYDQGPGRRRRGRARLSPRQRRDALAAYLLISPALLLFICFIAGPLIGAIVLSLFNYDLLNPPKFVGLGNFRYLLHDSVAWKSLLVTTEFTIASVVLHVLVGLGLALAVNRKMSTALTLWAADGDLLSRAHFMGRRIADSRVHPRPELRFHHLLSRPTRDPQPECVREFQHRP